MNRHFILAAAVCAVATGLSAAEYTWTGATGTNFGTAGNWNDAGGVAAAAPVRNDFVKFGETPGTVVLTAGSGEQTVSQLTLLAGGWTFEGPSRLSLASLDMAPLSYPTNSNQSSAGDAAAKLIVPAGTTTFNAPLYLDSHWDGGRTDIGVADGGTLALNGVVTSRRWVSKTGPGLMIINQTGTSGLQLEVKAGTVRITGTGDAVSGSLSVAGGVMDVQGTNLGVGSLEVGAAGTLTNTGATTRTVLTDYYQTNYTHVGNITGNLNVEWKNSGRQVTVNSANSYTGFTNIASNTRLVLKGDSLEGVAGTLGSGTGVVNMGGTSTSASTQHTRLLVDGAYTIGRDITINTGNDNRWIGLMDTATGPATFSGTLRLGRSGTAHAILTAGTGGRVNYTGAIVEDAATGLGSLYKRGDGLVTLTGDNAYAGGTIVEAGTLLVENLIGSGAGTGAVTVWDGAVLGGTGNVAGIVTLLADANADGRGGILRPTSATDPLTLGGLEVGANGALDLSGLTGLNPGLSYLVVSYGGPAQSFSNIMGQPVTHDISFATAGEVWLMPIPEPGTIGVVLLAGSMLMICRRSRKA